jgi:hypothetical protein
MGPILRVAAPVTDHMRVVVWPLRTCVGEAMNQEITGGVPTVMVVEAVTDPVALAAVNVYVVVVQGRTLTRIPVTVPTWSTVRLVAPVTRQLRVLS